VLSWCGQHQAPMKAHLPASRASRAEKVSVRLKSGNPNHHLWNNNGTWWMHYTVHHADHTKERKRIPLRTSNIVQARKRRDASFELFFVEPAPAEDTGAPRQGKPLRKMPQSAPRLASIVYPPVEFRTDLFDRRGCRQEPKQ
jgi:hypothetical protein